MPVAVFVLVSANALHRGFNQSTIGFALTMLIPALLLARFLDRRARGLPAIFGASAITEKSTPVTIDSVETTALASAAFFVGFSLFGLLWKF